MHHYYFISCEEDERAWIEISSMFNWGKLQELMLCLIGGENGKGERMEKWRRKKERKMRFSIIWLG